MHDLVVIGGGIVGLATAMTLAERNRDRPYRIVVLEKEDAVARHQTGHNSGVIHAGVYYAPGSLKATFCRAGVAATTAFCTRHQIPFEQCGKLIVATNAVEMDRMQALFARCVENGLDPELLDADALTAREPNVTGLGAIFVRPSGIVDYPAMCRAMVRVLHALGHTVLLNHAALSITERDDSVEIITQHGTFETRQLIVCAGLQADRMAKMAGLDVDFSIIPFRGEYYRLNSRHNDVVRHLIYPVPDPALPFLGVHLTRMIDGSVTVGPNAVLGFSREGYPKGSVNLRDVGAIAASGGFWRMVPGHLKSGLSEFANSLSKRRYLALCRKYCPSLTLDDLEPYPAGVRAQAVMADGSLQHDFLIKNTARQLHVCNAPSPAATSALPIAEHLADMVG